MLRGDWLKRTVIKGKWIDVKQEEELDSWMVPRVTSHGRVRVHNLRLFDCCANRLNFFIGKVITFNIIL